MKVKLIFAWFDMWVGAYWDKKKRALYLLPLPMVGVVIYWPRLKVGDKVKGCRHNHLMSVRSIVDDIVVCDYFLLGRQCQSTYRIWELKKQ